MPLPPDVHAFLPELVARATYHGWKPEPDDNDEEKVLSACRFIGANETDFAFPLVLVARTALGEEAQG